MSSKLFVFHTYANGCGRNFTCNCIRGRQDTDAFF